MVSEKLKFRNLKVKGGESVLYLNVTSNSEMFFNFTLKIITRQKLLGKVRTSETYRAALRSFMKFRDGVDVDFNLIDSDLIEMYESYLRNKGVTLNTISFYMRILRAVYNRAVTMSLTDQKSPFKGVYTGVDKTIKRAIDIKYIREIKNLDLSNVPSLEVVRDMFLFSFYKRGMSFVDMAFLRKSDLKGGVLTYRRRKTNQQLQIRWESCMQVIVERHIRLDSDYLLPIIRDSDMPAYNQYKNTLIDYNRKLKKIGEMVGITTPLTTYVARHSWASVAKSENIPISVISEGMGHESEKTTQIYLSSLDSSVIDKANDLILKLI